MEKMTFTVEEAAKILGLGRSAAYQAAQRGDIPTLRIGRRLLVPTAGLEQMLGVTPGTLTEAGTKATSAPERGDDR